MYKYAYMRGHMYTGICDICMYKIHTHNTHTQTNTRTHKHTNTHKFAFPCRNLCYSDMG